jgi:hypothetical protein
MTDPKGVLKSELPYLMIDPGLCSEVVDKAEFGGRRYYQCPNRPDVIRNGKGYCRLHDPEPDLLTACENLLVPARQYQDEGPPGQGWQSEAFQRIIGAAERAIARARAEAEGRET